MTIKLENIYGLTKADVLPTGGTKDQLLSKVDATNGNVHWSDPPKGGGLFTQNMTGKNAITLDCGQFDTFELNSMNRATTIRLSNFTAGMTIVIVMENAAVGITWADKIRWPRAIAPVGSKSVDTVVLTKVSAKIVGSYSKEQA